MATAVRALGVYPAPPNDADNVQSAIVVGGNQAWSDDNDATWVDYPHHANGDAAYAYADFPAITAPFTTWRLSVRAEAFNPDARAVVSLFRTDGSAFAQVGPNLYIDQPGVAWYDLPGDPNHAAVFTQSLRLVVSDNQGVVTGPNAIDFRIYEVILWVDGAARAAACNRIVQRGNDGLGLSGGRRILQGRTTHATNRRGNAIR